MADRYVSPTTGANSGNGDTPGAPWQTVAYALSNAASGDTIHLEPATYTNTLNFGTTKDYNFVNWGVSSPAGDGQVLFQVAATTNGIIRQSAAATRAYSFTDIDFEAQISGQAVCGLIRNDYDVSFTFTRCDFVETQSGTNGYAFGLISAPGNSGLNRSVTFTDCTWTQGRTDATNPVFTLRDVSNATFTRCTFTLAYAGANTSMDFLLSNQNMTSITMTNCTLTGGSTVAIFRRDTGEDRTYTAVTFSGCNFAPASGNGLYVGEAAGSGDTGTNGKIGALTVTGCTFAVPGYNIILGQNCPSITITNNTFSVPAGSSADRCVSFGTDPGTNKYGAGLTSVTITGNTWTYSGSSAASLHCLFLGQGVELATVSGNVIDAYHEIGIIVKGANNVMVERNIVVAPQPLYAKADSDGCTFRYNTAYAVRRAGSGGFQAFITQQENPTGIGLCEPTNLSLRNNILVADGSGGYCVKDDSDDDDAGNYDHNSIDINHNLYWTVNSAVLATIEGSNVTNIGDLQSAWANYTPDAGPIAGPLNDTSSEYANPNFIDSDFHTGYSNRGFGCYANTRNTGVNPFGFISNQLSLFFGEE